MILLDDGCIEMQRGKDDEVARPLFEHLIEIPDFEMAPHAHQQRALANAAPRAHPRCDRDPPLAVHLRRRDETETTSQQRIARSALPAADAGMIRHVAIMFDDAFPIIDEQAGIFGMQADEQIFPRRPRLNSDAEMIGKDQFSFDADRRHRTPDKEAIRHTHTTLSAYRQNVTSSTLTSWT